MSRRRRTWQSGRNNAKNIKVGIVTDMVKMVCGKTLAPQTVTRYLNGGEGYQNGPPTYFKDFLIDFNDNLYNYIVSKPMKISNNTVSSIRRKKK